MGFRNDNAKALAERRRDGVDAEDIRGGSRIKSGMTVGTDDDGYSSRTTEELGRNPK